MRPTAEDLEGRTLLSIGLDPTWGFGGVAQLNVPASNATNSFFQNIDGIALQNGQVVEAGSLTNSPTASGSSSTNSLFVARLTTSGFLDTGFGTGGMTTIPVAVGGVTYNVNASDIAVQSDGKIDVLGAATSPSSSPTTVNDLVVARLNPGGSIDTSFGTGGFELIAYATGLTLTGSGSSSLAIAPDGKLVVAATAFSSASSSDVFAVTRLNANGAPDTSFNTTGTATVPFKTGGSTATNATANSVVVQPDLGIVVAGSAVLPTSGSGTFSSTPSDIAVARLTTTGTLDTSFNGTGTLFFNYGLGGSNSSDSAAAVILQGTQIVIAGTSTQVFATTSSSSFTPRISELNVTRLNPNGSFDTTFNGSGKLLVPLNQGGITFNTLATTVVARPSGALLVGGTATEQSGSYYGGGPNGGLLVALTPTGALDTTFGTNGAAIVPNSINGRLLTQTDGKLVFISGNGVDRTTAPAPAVVTTTIVTSGTGKKAKATGVTITFNTAINPALASNLSAFMVRPAKGKKALKIRKGGISYNAATQTLTINFAKTAVGKGFQVLIAPGGVVGADGQVLFNGAATPIVIAPTTM